MLYYVHWRNIQREPNSCPEDDFTENLVAGPAAFEGFQKLIDQLDFFIAGLEFLVFMERLGGGGNIRQPVIDQREIVVDQRKVGFDLRRRLVMQTRQWKIACVIVKIREVVVSLDVARIVFQ